MKNVLILGAGRVTKPIVDYLTRECGHRVTMAARTLSKAGGIIVGNLMAKAVGLPPAIAVKLIFEGKIKETGVHMPPTLPYLYRPFITEMARYGFTFRQQRINGQAE